VDAIGKLLQKERALKSQLEVEAKPCPIAETRIPRYMEQLSELGENKTDNNFRFKSITELNLLYYAVFALDEFVYGEANSTAFSVDEINNFKSQRNELNARIIRIENFIEKEQNMGKYEISARVNPLADQSQKVKAMASVTIDNVVAINDLTVVEGKNGLFVGYPQSKDKDGSFRDIVQFLKGEDGKMAKESMELKEAIGKTLVDLFKNGERATPEKAGADKKTVIHEIKAFVTPLRDSQTATKGLATVQVGELFKIGSVRVNQNTKEGTENFGKNFVAMPSRPDKTAENGYRDVVHPVNREFGDNLRKTVLKQFDTQMEWKNRSADKEKSTPEQARQSADKSNPGLE